MSLNIYKGEKLGLQKIAGTLIADAGLDSDSTNAIQNKVVTEKLTEVDTTLESAVYLGNAEDPVEPVSLDADVLGSVYTAPVLERAIGKALTNTYKVNEGLGLHFLDVDNTFSAFLQKTAGTDWYTISGEAQATDYIQSTGCDITLPAGTFKFICLSSDQADLGMTFRITFTDDTTVENTGDDKGTTFTLDKESTIRSITISVKEKFITDNEIIKPMITTNMDLTFADIPSLLWRSYFTGTPKFYYYLEYPLKISDFYFDSYAPIATDSGNLVITGILGGIRGKSFEGTADKTYGAMISPITEFKGGYVRISAYTPNTVSGVLDMITDKEVTQAQSDVHVDEKEWFRYNGVLYVATKEINVGDTIVPNENCRATNIEDEMPSDFDPTEINQKIEGTQQMIASTEVVGDTFTSDMSKGQYFRHNNDLCLVNVDVTSGTALEENVNYSVVDMTSGVVGNLANLNWSASPSTVSSALESLGDIAELSTEAKNNIVSAINEIYEMAKKGGGGMPILDYANPLATISSTAVTTTEECWLVGCLHQTAGSYCSLKVNSTEVYGVGALAADTTGEAGISPLHLASGTTVVLTGGSGPVKLYRELTTS